MKNLLIGKCFISLIIILSVVDIAIADDNFSISVSCSIPEVPGLNAPPFGEKIAQKNTTATPPQDNEITNKSQEQVPSTIQVDTVKEIMLADGSTSTVTTQTVYSR